MAKGLMIAIVLSLLVSSPIFADTMPDENAVKDSGDKIMTKVAVGDFDGAFNLMKPYVPISGTEIDAAALQTKSLREQYGKRYGASVGFEFVDSKKVGDSLLKLRYIEKTKNHALPWVFIFYKIRMVGS